MILKLSPPWCVISKESVQQKLIDELCDLENSFLLVYLGPGALPRLTPPPPFPSGEAAKNRFIVFAFTPTGIVNI